MRVPSSSVPETKQCYCGILLDKVNLEIATVLVYEFTHGSIHFGDCYNACGVEYVRELVTIGLCFLYGNVVYMYVNSLGVNSLLYCF